MIGMKEMLMQFERRWCFEYLYRPIIFSVYSFPHILFIFGVIVLHP